MLRRNSIIVLMLDYLAWAAIIHGFILSLVYFFGSNKSDTKSKFLGLFIFVLLLEAVSMFLPVSNFYGYSVNHYFAIPEVSLFYAVFFMEYITRLFGVRFKLRNIFVIGYVISFGYLSLTVVNVTLFIFTGNNVTIYVQSDVLEKVYLLLQYIGLLAAIISVFYSYKLMKNYQGKIQELYSNISLSNLTWLKQFIFVLFGIIALWSYELLRIFFGGLGTSNVAYLIWLILFLFLYYSTYKAFKDKEFVDLSVEEEEFASTKKTLSLKEIELEDISNKLASEMEENKIYLQPDLTLSELAKKVNVPSRKVSNCIHERYAKNFSEWVNGYRVDEAIDYLSNPEHRILTIEGIGKSSGFKSRSSMYLAFKRVKGQSPGDFKR